MERVQGQPRAIAPIPTPEVQPEMSGMSLSQHLREVAEDEERRRQSGRSLSPIRSSFDPIFSDNPYGLAEEGSRSSESAKASAAKRERELSATKRAAQNRAAQRAFRQRKEGHIQELEQQVNRYKALGDAHKELQIENHQLREYVAILQSTVIDLRGEVPSVPPGLELNSTRDMFSLETGEYMSAAGEYMPPPAPTAVSAKRKEPSMGTFSTTKSIRSDKRHQSARPDPIPAFGPVTIGLRGGERDKTSMQNIEPRLMNA